VINPRRQPSGISTLSRIRRLLTPLVIHIVSLSFLRCSLESVLPLSPLLIFRRASTVRGRPRCASPILALCSGEYFLPKRVGLGLPRRVALILARVSSVCVCPRKGRRPDRPTRSFALVSSVIFRPRAFFDIIARVKSEVGRPLVPSPPSVRFTSGPLSLSCRPIAEISAISVKHASASVRFS